MTAEQSIAFLVFAVVAAITPGPSNLMLTATGAIAGIVRGLPCVAGVALGMGVLMFAVAMGLGQLVLSHKAVTIAIKIAGAAFLLWLAWKIATSRIGPNGSARKAIGFTEAALFQWVNPKSWLVSASAAGTYLRADADSALLQSAWLAALFVAAALPCNLIWLLFGAAMQRFLHRPRAARIFNVAMGASLAASVALILW